MHDKLALLCGSISSQFHTRTVCEGRKRGIDFGINLELVQKENEVWLTFNNSNETHNITFPIPFNRNGVELISSNNVERALCKHFLVNEDCELDYIGAIYKVICDDPSGIISKALVKKGPHLQRVIYGFISGNASISIYNLQKAINEVVNRMPLHETDMNSWVMNRRLMFVDQSFDLIQDPNERLMYHIEKNKTYFNRGWTSIGLSDGSLSNDNYILKCDLKKFTPFAFKHHNPQRNLYSTLGMKGDELPKVRSKSMQDGINNNMTRKGWNLFTAFVDIPDVFEDQIMVDKSHSSKFINYHRRFTCYGKCCISIGDTLKYNDTLSETEDGTKVLFDTVADSAYVKSVKETTVNVGNMPIKAFRVVVSYNRHLKDGTKITNMHGNKGVIRLKDLGSAVDPRTGKLRKIDILVSAKSVKKRKNFGQILEALINEIMPREDIKVIPDDIEVDQVNLETALVEAGLPEDGAMEIDTYAGKGRAVCGDVFWGVTKDAEDQLWDFHDTTRKNGRDIRTAGLKFSSVEFRALITRFGKDNPVLDEVLSYVQGSEDLHEQISILKSKMAEIPNDVPVLSIGEIKPLIQDTGTMFAEDLISGTVVDEFFYPNGFCLRLPLPYQVTTDSSGREITEGIPQAYLDENVKNIYNVSSVYIPSSNLRKCWKHGSGRFGFSDIGVLVNHIIKASHNVVTNQEDLNSIRMFYLALNTYFSKIALRMGKKQGEISTYGMAVRYPNSSKAVATLSNNLPKNTIEIHRDMADRLRVNTGDIVLAERFPCLGFMSIRPQKVIVTDDPLCKFTIRVSGNSLGSLSLDFDGDVLFLASFHTPEAVKALEKEWKNPNKSCYDVIKELNKKAGNPHHNFLVLSDYDLSAFKELTSDSHATLVERATGVKSHTGPVIALAYNVMRILENSDIKDNQKTNVAVEVFLDRVGNSVFKQKHGIKSLHEVVIDAICTGDVKQLTSNGFAKGTSELICNVIRQKATELGIVNLKSYHDWAIRNGRSKIINRIVKQQNKIYFASRSLVSGCCLIDHLNAEVVDWPSKMLKWVLAGKTKNDKTELEMFLDSKAIAVMKNSDFRECCETMCDYARRLLTDTSNHQPPKLSNMCLEESRMVLSNYQKGRKQ